MEPRKHLIVVMSAAGALALVALLLVAADAGTASGPLGRLELARERARVAVATNPQARWRVWQNVTAKRLREASEAQRRGRDDQVGDLAVRAAQAATNAAAAARGGGPVLRARALAQSKAVLEKLRALLSWLEGSRQTPDAQLERLAAAMARQARTARGLGG